MNNFYRIITFSLPSAEKFDSDSILQTENKLKIQRSMWICFITSAIFCKTFGIFFYPNSFLTSYFIWPFYLVFSFERHGWDFSFLVYVSMMSLFIFYRNKIRFLTSEISWMFDVFCYFNMETNYMLLSNITKHTSIFPYSNNGTLLRPSDAQSSRWIFDFALQIWKKRT